MASLLIIAPVVMAVAGTASVWAYLVGCLLAICVAFCMGELGSMYPVAGGLYSIIHRVLGRPLGFLALVDYIAQGVFLPACDRTGGGHLPARAEHQHPGEPLLGGRDGRW